MNCPNCNAATAPGAGFCASCGKDLPQQAPGTPGLAGGLPNGYPPGPQGYAPAPQGYPPAGYGQPPAPPYGVTPQGYGYQQLPPIVTRTSGMAIAGFVLSFFCGLLGLIFSILGNNEVKSSNGTVTGGGLAVAGIVISIVSMVINLAVLGSR